MPNLDDVLKVAKEKEQKKKFSRGNRPDTVLREFQSEPKPKTEGPLSATSDSFNHSPSQQTTSLSKIDNESSHNIPVVEDTNGILSQRFEIPEVKITTGLFNQSLSKPLVETTSSRINQTSIQPEVKKTIGVSNHSSELPVVDKTSGNRGEGWLQKYLPKDSELKVENKRGDFMIPHEIFEFCQKAIKSKNELIVFNCLLRFTLGFHRDTCEAGYSFISEWSGLKDKQNIAKALKRLINSGLVQKIGEHDSRTLKGAIYQIPLVSEYLKNKVRGQLPVVDSTSGKNNQSLNQPLLSGQDDHSSVVDSTTKKENSKKDKENSLSKSKVENYLESLPVVKSKKEREAFLSLKKNYSEGDIEACFLHLQAHGELKTGEPCHSPLSYLSLAMNDVLKKIQDNDKKSRVGDQSQRFREENQQKEMERQKEEEVFKLREAAFVGTFPNQESQMEQIEKMIEKLPMKVSGELARRIAITTWWENNHIK